MDCKINFLLFNITNSTILHTIRVIFCTEATEKEEGKKKEKHLSQVLWEEGTITREELTFTICTHSMNTSMMVTTWA